MWRSSLRRLDQGPGRPGGSDPVGSPASSPEGYRRRITTQKQSPDWIVALKAWLMTTWSKPVASLLIVMTFPEPGAASRKGTERVHAKDVASRAREDSLSDRDIVVPTSGWEVDPNTGRHPNNDSRQR